MENSSPQANDEDSESESDLESVDPEVAEARLSELLKQLDQNPNDYDLYINLIKACKDAGNFIELRNIRHKFRAKFPLSEKLWIEWIEDESRIGGGKSDRENVFTILQKATKDYLSIPIWTRLLEFVFDKKNADIVDCKTREEWVEKSITVAGYDISRSYQIWTFCIENAEKSKKQELMTRLLGVPLLELYENGKFQEILQKLITQDGNSTGQWEAVIKKATNIVKARSGLEHRIGEYPELARSPGSAVNDKSLAKIWYEYIQLECSNKNKASFEEKRVLCVFERAVACCCLSANLWLQYLAFVDHRLKNVELSLEIHEKAVRNCPWSSDLWVSYLRAVERRGTKSPESSKSMLDKQQQVISRALSSFFRKPDDYLIVLLAECECRRRQHLLGQRKAASVIEMYDYSKSFMSLRFPNFGLVQLFRSRMTTEYGLVSEKTEKNKLDRKWIMFLKDEASIASYKEGLIFLESSKSLEVFREVCRLGLQQLKADAEAIETICRHWRRFESDHGSISDLDNAESRIGTALRELSRRKANSKQKRISAIEKRTSLEGKRKRPNDSKDKTDTKKVKRDKKLKTQRESSEKQRLGPTSVFVINLKYGLSEESLARFFVDNGCKVKTVAVLSGRNRGRGKITFEDPSFVSVALQLSGQILEGYPIQVLPYKKKKTEEKNKNDDRSQEDLGREFMNSNPDNTVVVSNLSPDACADLQSVFGSEKNSGGNLTGFRFEINERLSNCGKIENLKVLKNSTTAFILFDLKKAAQDAISLGEDQDLCNGVGALKPRTIHITKYTPETIGPNDKHKEPAKKVKKSRTRHHKPSTRRKARLGNRQQGNGAEKITSAPKSNDYFKSLFQAKNKTEKR